MAAEPKKQLHCAIYTRKSTEEGLDKDFNSLDAQREACAAYILSQSQEGWTQLADHYDDGGFSGGSMERPALRRLLADVAAGRVDVVVVYKIDRLTRSLADFAKIVDVLDEADASFVSVTQSFNTTSSMGRLTLNVLLSFAQFEREVAAERIRDKIAASKKRGMWMGGPVPLGYEVKERKLVVVPSEAATVRTIMQRYLESAGVPSLVEELERDGVVSKQRVMRDGSVTGGTSFRRGALAHLLSNRIYLGLITHKGSAYQGEHEAIVEQEMFDQVQAKLQSRASSSKKTDGASQTSILAGRIQDRHGRPMSPCYTQNHGKRYRYYASIPRDGSKEPAVRLRASELEQSVVAAINAHLCDAINLRHALPSLEDAAMQKTVHAAHDLSNQIEGGDGPALKQLLAKLNLKITVSDDAIQAVLDLSCLVQGLAANDADGATLCFAIPASVNWNSHEPRLKLDPPVDSSTRKSEALLDLIARAFDAKNKLLAMDEGDIAGIPLRHRRHLERTARLSYLAPDIIVSILDGKQPSHLSARRLVRASSLPLDWAEQRRMLLAN